MRKIVSDSIYEELKRHLPGSGGTASIVPPPPSSTGMAELKTRKTGASVAAFLSTVADPAMRRDAKALVALMKAATGARPRMWGPSIVGFGDWHYKSERSGREGDWFVMGFSPRKSALTLYLMAGLRRTAPLLEKLGRHKTSGGCLSIKRLEDVDMAVLRKILRSAAVRS
jgi:hypothetical protein